MPSHHQGDALPSDAGIERLIAGRYRLLSILGYGGMGTVWRAFDEVLQREVAVKEVRAPDGMPTERVERMYARLNREAWAAARISARGVVTVHDVARDDGRPWIVMEFVRGRSLADVLALTGALPPREVARVGFEVWAALRAAHDVGVLHRDVKPANVLLADDGRVVLTDFGIAAVEGESALTMTGEVIGSPEYLAPERALGRAPGPASDLWSLGVLLYAAVQGRSPFRRTTALATMRAVVDDQLPDPHRAGPLACVIEGLTRKDPAERMSAEEAGLELRLSRADSTERSESPPDTVNLPDAEFPHGQSEPTTAASPPVPAPSQPTDPRVMLTMTDIPEEEELRTSAVPEPTADGLHPATPNPVQTTTVVAPTVPTGETAVVAPHSPVGIASMASMTARQESVPPPSADSGGPGFALAAPVGTEASSSRPTPRRRRIGYLIAAAGAVVTLIAGGLGYAVMDGDSADRPDSGSHAGQGQDATPKRPVSIMVTSEGTRYVGDCPPTDSEAPRFTANFTVSELPIQFSYRWVSSNGSVVDQKWRTLAFREGDPRTHKETVRLSAYARAGTLRSELAVEIRSPFDAESNSVPFSLTCDSSTSD